MIPYINEQNGIKTLFVNDRPFIVRGGELHNSSASDLAYMESHVWPNLKTLNMNTVILPVAWETIEPREGCFDFSLAKLHQRFLKLKFRRILKRFFMEMSVFLPVWKKAPGPGFLGIMPVNYL